MYWNFFKSNVNVEAALEKNLGKAKNIENLKPLYANDSDFDKGYTFFVNTLNECKTDPRIMADIKKVDLDLIRANCSSIHASKKSKSKSITSLSVSKYPSMFFTWTSREDNVISEERVFAKKDPHGRALDWLSKYVHELDTPKTLSGDIGMEN